MKARIWPLLAFFLLALLAGLSDRALIRDGDQGAMLAGALRLAEGASAFRTGFYAYDRSWLAYGLTAAIFRMARIGAGAAHAVVVANTLNFVLYWFAWLWLVARLPPRPPYHAAAWCVLAAPVSVLASIYWNTTALSSAMVALGILTFLRPGRGRTIVGAGCFAAAVGMRIDVLLLAPLAVWLFASPRLARGRIRPLRILRNRGLAAAGGMLAAALTGRWLAGGQPAVADPYFDPLVVLGYAVFATGSIALLCAAVAAGWRRRTGKTRTWLFSAAGLAALLLPWLFYLPQLHSPRYLMRGGEAVLLLLVSPRGRAWLRYALGRSVRFRYAVTALATMPLILGVQFAHPLQPRPTLSAPTLMPTGDGWMPMGAVASFMLRMRRASTEPVDHNQILWQTLQAAHLPETDVWRVLNTPQIGLFDLHAALRGSTIEHIDVAAAAAETGVVAETRMMMRHDPKQPGFDQAAVLLHMPAVPISPCIRGIRLVRLGEGDHAWSRDLLFLRELFDGAEFRILSDPSAPLTAGHTAVFFSDGPFRVVLRHADKSAPAYREAHPAGSTRHVAILHPARTRMRVHAEAPDDRIVHRADSALPAWMTR